MKKLSIITINYNNCEGLRKTIESVIKQTFTDYEYIIIDGGSTDGSVEIIKEYTNRITYWISEPDKGIYNAMNKGILKSKGQYLNFMNSGDCFYQKETLKNVFNKEINHDIIVGDRIISTGNVHIQEKYILNDISLFNLYKKGICHQASFIKKDLFINDLYNENFKIISDWEFFVKKIIFNNCTFYKVNEIIVDYDFNGISNINYDLLVQEKQEVLKKMLPERIYTDYKKLQFCSLELMTLVYQLTNNYGFQKLVCKIIKIMLKIYTLIKPLINKSRKHKD